MRCEDAFRGTVWALLDEERQMSLSRRIVDWPEESKGQAWLLHQEGFSGKEVAK
jgi:hypothetical protein